MLIDKLKDWDYYCNKLPLYVRNSYGIKEHFEILYELMLTLDSNEDDICDCFNFLQNDYENKVIKKYSSLDAYDFKFLDMIASIYGISRAIDVKYVDEDNNVIEKQLRLNNKELYTFIKTRIIQNNYDGSYKQAIEYYRSIGLSVQMFFDPTEAAKCDIYLDVSVSSDSDNIRALFLAGMLTLKSVGITYNEMIVSFDNAGVWDGTESHGKWDVATWL